MNIVVDNFQQKKEKRIRRVLDYLKIDDPYEDDENTDLIFNICGDEQNNVRDTYKICELVVDKQQEILSRTGVMVPIDEIMKKAILRGLYECKI